MRGREGEGEGEEEGGRERERERVREVDRMRSSLSKVARFA